MGNATSVTIDGVQSTGTYDAANELTAFGDTTYTYDSNGNRLTATTAGVTTTYGYDARNELVSLSGPVTASYTYNGAGERVSKTVNGTTTTYTWDPTGLGTVIADGTVENVFGPIGLAEQVTDSSQTSQFAGADALGTIRLITDGSGNVVGTGSYSPWGVPDSGSLTLNGFGFAGEQIDPESGFVYLRRRSYDPTTGRFLTPDPLGLPGSGVNLYAYVHNNPLVRTDPTGQQDVFDEGFDGYGFGGGGLGGGDVVRPGGSGGVVEPPAGVFIEPELPEGFIGPVLPAEGPSYGPFLPAEPPAGAGAFSPLGEGEFCPLTEGEGNGGGRKIRPIQSGSGEEDWGNPATLQDHFQRHGADFGAQSEQEYAQMAHDFYLRAQQENLQTKVDPRDGTIRVYDPQTNTFGSYNANGSTRTFFKPTAGQAYFDGQPGVSQ